MMNRIEMMKKPLAWFTALLLAAIVAGCGGSSGSSAIVSSVDVAAPTVSSTAPANAASGVALNANISATFSELMDATTISSPSTTFTLAQSGTPVAGAVSYMGTTATFNPTADLTASSVYTATVLSGASGVADLAGNTLAVDKVWSFTTGAAAVVGAAPVDLGTAINYAVLAKAGVTTVPTSVVTGHVGVSPNFASSLTGWSQTDNAPPPITYSTSTQVVAPFQLHAADYTGGTTSADLTTAVLNMETAYTDAAGRTVTSAATTDVGSGTLTSLTLAPGVYQWGTAVNIPTDLTLNGSATDVWIFKVAGTLDMASAKNVILTGGALPKNIFWQVSGAVTIGANTHFEGVILSQTSITFNNLSSINGRLLAQTAVTLNAATVTQPAP